MSGRVGVSHVAVVTADLDRFRAFYEDTNFLRSVTVTKIEHEIAHPSPLHPGHP